MTTTIERNIPASYTATRGNDFATVHYQANEIGAVCGMGFRGNKRKSSWHHRFPSLVSFLKFADEYLAGEATLGAEKAQRQATRDNFDARTVYSVGEIIENSWGYEQTNWDFYQVTGVTRKFLKLRKLATVRVSDGPQTMTGKVNPVRNVFTGPEIRRGCSAEYVSMTHGGASKWEGKARHYSCYA